MSGDALAGSLMMTTSLTQDSRIFKAIRPQAPVCDAPVMHL